jgi:2-oxoglutarate dehydrogenase E1 component
MVQKVGSVGSPRFEQVPSSLNLGFIEELYAEFVRDPANVSADWRAYFEMLTPDSRAHDLPRTGPSFTPSSLFNPPGGNGKNGHPVAGLRELEIAVLQDRVDQLVRAFRVRGHMIAKIDPLGMGRSRQPELDPEYYGLTQADMDRVFSTDTIRGPAMLPLRRILDRLRNTYCRSIGVQFMHMDDLDVRLWLQDRMEETENRITLRHEEQVRIFKRLTGAVLFEEFIQKRFQGKKSFSLEGAETLIPLMDMLIERGGSQGIKEVVIGMAHRGRLNVLANIMNKGAQEIFREFADLDPKLHLGRGDVKYHLGYSSDWCTAAGQNVHLSLCFNPSHLEFVSPVVVGRVRSKQDRGGDSRREKVLGLVIHGDAAIAGEGVVQETFNISQLAAYHTGGTIHVVVNNQIGFITSPQDGRSTEYATDVAKMLQIPIFHVNGEDPEAVAQVVRLAMDFRAEFKRDVVIDMYCYRRRGHNEQDEPAFTHPLLYRAIEKRKSVRDAYLEHLLDLGEISVDEAAQISREQTAALEQELSVAKSDTYVPPASELGGIWKGYIGGRELDVPEADTGVPVEKLSQLLLAQSQVPGDFHPHPKIQRILDARAAMARGEKPLDWAAGESLAFATLAVEGHRIRMSGQDSTRGTFSHRHAVLHDHHDGHRYTPLRHLASRQAPVEIYNSSLSENAVLGFEYGYSLDCPDGLTLWEAQFGDFVNAAQVIVDQFIASAESKWRRLSNITLLLPHGFEGAGPEHSSARLERFLNLGADMNWQIVYPTTPAQFFHALRRQVIRKWRKPLVVMTPKSMLRNPHCVSNLADLSSGTFKRVIPDNDAAAGKIDGVLLCSGKIYWELLKEREDLGRHDVAILRIEQLYPTPMEPLRKALEQYPDGTPVYWVQEEPENQGAWRYLFCRFGADLFDRLPFSGVYRRASSSPATGSENAHKLEQKELLMQAFACI